MANEMQRGNLTGTAIMRMPISGTVSIGGKQMKELRFMPYSEFPEEGREDVLYIDTDGNAMYYWNGTEYTALSGGGSGGTSNYNELSNKPSINDITLTDNKTSADLGLQPTISDIATIRSGAASGATAVQPSDMETALASKQDVIDDLSDIRTGAAAGETAVQPSALETALSGKQDVISDLDAIRSGAAAGNTALQPEDIDTLPTDGSSNPVSSGGTYNFVNSSIATNTAYFIGTFASVAELEAYTGTVTNNDYAFVTSTDSAGNTLYNRYKYNAATLVWSFEYAVNNTAFTTAQWAAIQSGMTSADKTKLDGIEQGANKTVIDAAPTSGSSNAVSSGGVHTALSGKQDTIADLSDIRSGASAGATAVQPSALNDYQTKLSGTNKLDPAYINYDSTHAAVTDSDKTTWSGKQDAINDLSTIRSGSEAGATAVQTIQINGTAQTKTNGVVNLPAYPTTLPASDTTSTYSSSGTVPVNGTAVAAALGTLDVSSVGGTGKYISAIKEIDGKISATPATMDTTPTANSTNPVTSGGVAASQAAQDAEIAWNVNHGVKNILDIQHPSVTKNTSYTVTSDGGVELSCSKATWTQYNIADIPVVSGSEYTFTFYVDTISGTDKLQVFVRNTNISGTALYNSATISATGTYTATITPTASKIWVGIYLNNSATAKTASAKIRAMLCPAVITDSTFQPYALPNPTLTPAVIKSVDEGSKNKLPITIQSQTVKTVSFTVNSDGSITANGTVKGGDAYLNLETLIGDKYIGMILSGGTASLKICISKSGSGQIAVYSESSEGVVIPDNATNTLFLFAPNGTVLTNVTVKPMICTAADWAVSQKFVPYAPTNRELYEMIQALQNA